MPKTAESKPEDVLREYMDRLGWSERALAREIRVSHSTVGCWLVGASDPSLQNAFRLEEAIGMPVSAWRRKEAA